MKKFEMPVQVRWSDVDANHHVRHSVYYDWGAMCRMEFLTQEGLSDTVFSQLQVGPILFREESKFRREIRMHDKIRIDLQLLQAKRDFSRWSIRHSIWKEDNTEAAILTVDGAFLDIRTRKLTTPPELAFFVFSAMPSCAEFQWIG
ncbi:MAG: acyl-CoA thioesterase [Chitinophagaceae bacterium]|jgi:acyl-CoA thioester hydrolase